MPHPKPSGNLPHLEAECLKDSKAGGDSLALLPLEETGDQPCALVIGLFTRVATRNCEEQRTKDRAKENSEQNRLQVA